MLKENGLKLFELTFAPSRKAALVFYTRGIQVCLPEDQMDTHQLQALLMELNNPSHSVVSLIRILASSCKGASETGKRGIEEITGKLDRELKGILGHDHAARDLSGAPKIKIYFSIKDISKFLREWRKERDKGFWGPNYYFLSIERGAHEVIRSIFSLDKGFNFSTYIYPQCTRFDLQIQKGLMGLFANLSRLVVSIVK